MTRRAGMSLTEVLVALFIMALGTIAILTMFPLGAIQMGQALRDDRTAQAATQADSFMRMYWQANVCEPLQGVPTGAMPDSNLFQAFTDPSTAAVNAGGTAQKQQFLLAVTAPGPGVVSPSYPVVVDPMGAVARLGSANQLWVFGRNQNPLGTSGTNQVRMNLATITNAPNAPKTLAFRTCSLLDGLGYNTFGLSDAPGTQLSPPPPIPSTVDRETRYNWLWVLQQPDLNSSTSANMVVVVFDKRTHLFAPPTAEQLFTPVAVPGSNAGLVGSTQVSFTQGSAPPVQKGDWLMDVTVTHMDCGANVYIPNNPPPIPSLPPPPAPAPFPPFALQQPVPLVRNGNFYRVISITDNPITGTTDIEFQTPLKPESMTPLSSIFAQINPSVSAATVQTIQALIQANSVVQPNQRQFVLMTGVVDVFDRAPLSYP